MGSNYLKMKRGAQALFLERDLDGIARRWKLESDAAYIYASYFGQKLRVRREDAEISLAEPAEGSFLLGDGVNEAMVLFDLMTYAPERPRASGRWASVSTLGGIIGAGHDRTLSHEKDAAKFSGRLDALEAACRRMGGVALGKADVSYAFTVFADFAIWFQFWDGDDEFPASIKYLFDENALKYMHYETLWYVMGSVMERLEYYGKQA